MTCHSCFHYKTNKIEDFPAGMSVEQIEVERRKGLCTAHPPACTAIMIPIPGGGIVVGGKQNLNVQVQGITFWPTVWEHEKCGEWKKSDV